MLSCVSAAAAAFAVVAAEQAIRGAVGLLAGMTWQGFEVAPPAFLPRVVQGGTPGGALGWMALALTGPIVIAGLALVLFAVVNFFRSSGWLRSLTLSLTVLALLWLPMELIAAALPGGAGPVDDLYAALGNPPAGRWGTLMLGVILLWGMAGPASRRAVTTARAWMRADSQEFRRRLVRVVAGYPAGIAMAAAAVAMGWMTPGLALIWGLMVLVMLMIRTA